MIKLIYRSIAIAGFVALGLSYAPIATAQEETGEQDAVIPTQVTQNNDDLDFSSDGRSGNRTGGGSRSECPNLNPPLTALAPSSNAGTTIASHPTIWVYVPYTSAQAPIGEFVLQNDQRDDIVRLSFTLPETPGFVSVTVPDSEAALTGNEWHLWYFNLYCDPDQNAPPIFAQGWIQRVELTNEPLHNDGANLRLDQYYAQNGIWFDALNELATLRRDRPSDPGLLTDWQMLLGADGVELTIAEPEPTFVGHVHVMNSAR